MRFYPLGKPFLWPFPSSGTVEPGEEMVLTIVLDVNEEWAAKLSLGEEDGNDVLVLQVDGGKDTVGFLSTHIHPLSRRKLNLKCGIVYYRSIYFPSFNHLSPPHIPLGASFSYSRLISVRTQIAFPFTARNS